MSAESWVLGVFIMRGLDALRDSWCGREVAANGMYVWQV